MVEEIQIQKLTNEGNGRNSRYSIDVSALSLKELGIYTKVGGTKSEGHFHKGENKSRDPEYVYVIKGKIKLFFEDLEGNKHEEVVSEGELLITPAWIYHSYEVLENLVILEPREVSYSEIPDTYEYKEFLKYKK